MWMAGRPPAWALTLMVSVLLILGFRAAAFAQMSAYGLAATVNGAGISNETLEQNFQEYLRENRVNIAAIQNPERLKAMRREVLDLLIEQELAWQAAQKAEVLATEAEVDEAVAAMRAAFKSEQAFVSRLEIEGYTEASYRQHMRRLASARKYLDRIGASAPAVSDEAVHAFFAENPDKFTLPEHVRARHILVKVAPGTGEDAKRAAREKIARILEEVLASGDFAAAARKYSEDSTAAQGGDLGFFPRGRMVKPFEDAAFALKEGAVSDLVKTPFGFHLIKVEERRAAGPVTEEAAREQIRAYLRSVRAREAVQAELQRLRSAAKIDVHVPM
ncbi:MAG TPA: peptidylprolyl isomerase [Candidatus Methylomirabilis sp.]|nr:peptidylprolyl isomerase [Candidatus Methylomirabilis sp.]